ncbi:MAG: hypothetical protein ABIT08_00940 [Bacteroidia bacterium]
MNSESIKSELLDWLQKLNDKSILTSLLQFKKASETGDWFDNLTSEQLDSLQRGLNDIKNGDTLTSEQFWKSYGRKI